MENTEMEALLKLALTPVFQADVETDQAIIDGSKSIRKPMKYKVFKVAALILIFVVLGAGTVYAGRRIFNQIIVTDHAISVGKPTNTTREDIENAESHAGETRLSMEDAAPGDKWLRKEVKDLEGLINTYYFYEDYETALCDIGLANIFSGMLEKAGEVQYVVGERDGKTVSLWLLANFRFENGWVRLFEYMDKKENENLSEGNGFRHSLILDETENIRQYISNTGREYTLVDSNGTSYVMISYENIAITLSFTELKEEGIRQVLDMLQL